MGGFGVADVAPPTENASTLVPPVEQPWLPALLNEDAQSGFDVMDILDGILQDGSNTQEEPAVELEAPAPGTPSRIVGGTTGNPTITQVLANPWATESKSRAAAYGISFDDDDENNVNSSSPTGINSILK